MPNKKQKRCRSFEDARKFVLSLNLNGVGEWFEYSCGHLIHKGKRPADIPKSPHVFYRSKGWNGWDDWLGTSSNDQPQSATAFHDFCSFEEARKYARKLGLESHYEWNRFVCTHLKTMPSKIPLNPAAIYRFEWKGWNDWIGTA